MKPTLRAFAGSFFLAALSTACSSSTSVGNDGGPDAGPFDAGSFDAGPVDAGASKNFCALPGSVVFNGGVRTVVDGGTNVPDFSWLTLPSGFCVHEFATVPDARTLRFAPGGELFVSSPTTSTTGGNSSAGLASIIVIPDDDGDGVGDAQLVFKSGLQSTQGMLFANGSFYYQDHTQIMVEPYTAGQRADNGQAVQLTNTTYYVSSLHWPKSLDISDSGKIYIANGGDQDEACHEPMPTHGAILQAGGTACTGSGADCGATPIVKGLRNPYAIRCHHDGHDRCYANELSLDYSASSAGREKLIPIDSGDNWGFPCCATQGVPYAGLNPVPNCSAITDDTNSFEIGNTPFGLDFEDNQFFPPWDHKVMIALHGEFGNWSGARIVAIATDPSTGVPYPSSTTSGSDSGNIADFAIGWDDGTRSHGRPAEVVFSPDGRMFVGNDVSGQIFWISPVTP